ncbi:hypothetical protein [Brevibacillus sp. NRS-1366]|uniref:hypothetical protein n=1 Tax=Brevibacillus sp. NRS-1366 TaxID=3233899 RepID=UPI003D1EAC40
MVNNNDQKILELKKQIEEKKSKLSKSQKFAPVTNCSIEVDGVRYNIQVLQKEQIITLLVKLNTYVIAAKDLDLLSEYKITGYNVMDWISDLKAKLDNLSRKEEEQKLKVMEAKLDQLLSNEKKVELELGEIENMLNE